MMFTDQELRSLRESFSSLQNKVGRLYSEVVTFSMPDLATADFDNRVAARMSQLNESQAVAQVAVRAAMLQEMANLVDRIMAADEAASPADNLR